MNREIGVTFTQMTKQNLQDRMVLQSLEGIDSDFEDDSVYGRILRKRVEAFNPNASPADLDRTTERCREKLKHLRLKNDIARLDQGLRRVVNTQAKQSTARISKPGKRSARYEAIDRELETIAEADPQSHREVFDYLDGRIRQPNAEPFASAHGWTAGFKKDPARARIWLSKRWSALNLPKFLRGPK
jgi:hypothetical protein